MTTPDPQQVAEQVRWLVGAMTAVMSNEDELMDAAAGQDDAPEVPAEFLAAVTMLSNKLIFDVSYFSGRSIDAVLAHLGEWSAGLPD